LFLSATQGAGDAPGVLTPSSPCRRAVPASGPHGSFPEETLAMFRAWRRQGEACKRILSVAERSAQTRRAVTDAGVAAGRPRGTLAVRALGDGHEGQRPDPADATRSPHRRPGPQRGGRASGADRGRGDATTSTNPSSIASSRAPSIKPEFRPEPAARHPAEGTRQGALHFEDRYGTAAGRATAPSR
jgi:hypothetical protein